MAAAKTAKDNGHEVVVFEADAMVGGRCTTLALSGFLFDSGATSIAPRGKELESFMLGPACQDALIPVSLPIYTHQGLRISAGDSAKSSVTRYVLLGGNITLPNRLATGLDIRLNRPVQAVDSKNGKWLVDGEPFDVVVLAVPTPIASQMVEAAGSYRPIQSVSYRQCISVLLGYAAETPRTAYHALVEPEQRHPLTWLSVESAKAPDRAPEGHSAFVAQLSPEYSKTRFLSTDESIVEQTTNYVERLYGSAFAAPLVSEVVRWTHSQPEQTAMFESVNRDGATLIVAGDGVMGPRVEWAYEAGVRAARMIS